MQDGLQALGKPFVYVITPSKVAQYPQFIPDGYKCPAGFADKGSKLKVWDDALTRHGVRFVDGASPLPAARENTASTCSRAAASTGTSWRRPSPPRTSSPR